MHVGQRVTVFLSVAPDPPDSAPWMAITASDGTVLAPVPNGALSLARGVTGGAFAAERMGTSRLISDRPACTAPAPCPAQLWQVIIVVEG
jgi:hypothetical protein